MSSFLLVKHVDVSESAVEPAFNTCCIGIIYSFHRMYRLQHWYSVAQYVVSWLCDILYVQRASRSLQWYCMGYRAYCSTQQQVQKFTACNGTWKFFIVLTRTRPWSLSLTKEIQSSPLQYYSLKSTLILSCYMCPDFPEYPFTLSD
jgi:hypothetical protein